MLSHTVLDSLALGYEPVWNRERQLAAVRLCVHPIHAAAVDAAHLMQALGDDWPESAPVLIISIDSPRLLQQALACAPVHNTWLEVPAALFGAGMFSTPSAISTLIRKELRKGPNPVKLTERDQDIMTMRHIFPDCTGGQADTIFVILDLLGHTDAHRDFLLTEWFL